MKGKKNSKKQLDEKQYRAFIGLLILWILYHTFFKPRMIGHDSRYNLFIFWMPLVLGVLILWIYRRRYLLNEFSNTKGLVSKLVINTSYLLQSVVFSYLSLGQFVDITWNEINRSIAKTKAIESFNCEITRFRKGRNNSIEFNFQGSYEKIDVSYKTIEPYLDKNPTNYKITIDAQQGIWNYYLLDKWDIKEK
jgi:hypothetical protein